MKFPLALILLSCVFLACSSSEKGQPKEIEIELDSTIVNFAKEYIKVNKCEKCLNDITIDKILPDSTIITIRTQTSYKRYFQENPVRQIIRIEGVPFFLYTGIEQFRKDLSRDTTEVFFEGNDCGLVTWTIINSKEGNQFLKYGGEPFYYPDFNSPESVPKKVEFLAPDG